MVPEGTEATPPPKSLEERYNKVCFDLFETEHQNKILLARIEKLEERMQSIKDLAELNSAIGDRLNDLTKATSSCDAGVEAFAKEIRSMKNADSEDFMRDQLERKKRRAQRKGMRV